MTAAETARKITSADVRAALKLRFEPASHALLFEVANATGAGARRYADAVAIGLWPSHGHKIEGVEIKVTRADFLSEMKDATKSQAVFRFCNHWWLACPRGMVTPEELPPTWGLLELMENGTLRTRVKAPKLDPEPVDLGFLASLVRRHAGVDEEMAQAMLARMRAELRSEYDRDLENRRRNDRDHRAQAVEAGIAMLDKIQAETGLDLRNFQTAHTLLPCIKVAQALGHGWSAPLPQLRRHAQNLLKALDECGLEPEGGSDGTV
jgi:hypothetical protein